MDNIDRDQGKYSDLVNHKVSFDQEAMWADISNNRSKKKLGVWLLWIFGITLFLILVASYFYSNNDASVAISSPELNPNTKISHKVVKQDLPSHENITKKNQNTLDATSSTVETGNQSNINSNETTSREIDNQKHIETLNKVKVNLKKEPVSNKEHIASIEKASSVLSSLNTSKETNNTHHSKELNDKSTKDDFDLTHILEPIIPIESSMIKSHHVLSSLDLPAFTVHTPLTKPKESPFSFSIWGSYGMIRSNITGSNELVVRNRRSSEKPLESIGIGMELSRKLGKRISILSGLNLEQISTEMSYNQIRIGNIENMSATDIPAYITIKKGILIKKETRHYFNTVKIVKVPIIIEYQLPIPSFPLSVTSGVSINVFVKNKGNILNEYMEPVEIHQFTSSSSIINFQCGLKYKTIFMDKTLFLGPTYQLISKNKIMNTEERIHTINLKLGISF